ncbi:MAG: hypothetical protein AB1796_07195 [Bacillota bacterium]
MAAKRKAHKKNLCRNILVSATALILVAGLVLSAALGFADFLISGDRRETTPAAEDYPSMLEGLAASLEEALAASPDDGELKMQLADLYLELAMVHGSLGAVEPRDRYAQRGEELLQQAEVESPAYAGSILKLALVAAFYQDDDLRAEEYFREAVDLDRENAQVHLYYGMFLALRERSEEARVHLEKVLEMEPEESYLAELARLSMEEYVISE